MIKLLKKGVKSAFYRLAYSTALIKAMVFARKHKEIAIFDIDNTIADSWPSFLVGYDSERIRLSSIRPFSSMIELVHEYSMSGKAVLFLTARDFHYYSLTKRWLKTYFSCEFALILVSHPREKIKIIGRMKSNIVHYFDDLSYAHESGQVKFYNEEIDALSKMPCVTYVGYDDLLKLQESSNE